MRKSTLLAMGLVLMLGASLFAGGKPEPKAADSPFAGQTLTLSQWGYNMDLLEKNYIKPFEQKYGVTIVNETGNNADRLTKLNARKGSPIVDVVFFAGNFAYQAMNEGLLAPYDPAKIPNLSKIIPAAKDPLGGRYAVGYSLSHLGIFYRTDKTAPITSWRDLSRPELRNFVSLPGINTTFGPGVIYMLSKAWGSGINDTETGWAKMAELAPALKTAYNNSAELNSLITQEEVFVAPYTSFSWGDIEKSGHPVASAVPKEGLVGTFSTVSIVNGTKNVDLAHAFIDFLISYEVQLAEAMDLVDSPVHVDVKLPPEIGKKLTYGDEIVNNLYFYKEEEVAKNKADWLARWNRIFSK